MRSYFAEYSWLFVAILSWWLFVAILGWPGVGQTFLFRGYSWLFVAIRGYSKGVAIFLAASGYFSGYSWLSVAIRGYSFKNSRPWLFLPRGCFMKVQ